jgi:hypothetical protein
MIHDKYKGLDPISFKVAAYILAGAESKKDPAVKEHIQKLINAANEGDLKYIQSNKKVPVRRIRHPGIGTWVRDGVQADNRDLHKSKIVIDWWESKVYRKDVNELYKKSDVNFYCDGISPVNVFGGDKSVAENTLDNLAKEDNSNVLTKRTKQKVNTQDRNTRIQKVIEQLARDKNDKGEDFNKTTLATEMSKLDEFKGIDKETILRNTKVTWKK